MTLDDLELENNIFFQF